MAFFHFSANPSVNGTPKDGMKLNLSKPNVTQLNSTQPKATVKATSLG